MKPTSYRSIFALAAFGLASLPASLSAQIVWDGSGDGTTYEDGSNWTGDTAPADDLTTDVAQLTGGSVNLSTSRQVNGLDLNTSSTLLGGGSLEIGAGGLSGTENLSITGTTLVDLNGTDSSGDYTGDIFIGAGATLSSERDSLRQIGVFTDTFITLDGGTLSQSNNHLDLTGRDIILGAGGGTLRHLNNRNIFGGYLISGAGHLTLEGANTDVGRVQLTEINTYTGGTTVKNGAQAWLYNNNSFGAADTAISLESGGKLFFAANHDFGNRVITVGTGGGIIDTANRSGQVRAGVLGSDDLRVDGGGLLEWYADSSAFTGNLVVDEGTEIRVRTSAADMLGTGVITLDNGAFIKNRNNSFDVNNDIVLGSGGGGIEVGWTGKTITVNGDISGDGQLSINNDSSSTRIRGNNTYTGGTLIQGRLNVDQLNGLGTGKVTLDSTGDAATRGWLQNRGGALNIDGGLEIAAGGGRMKAGWSSDITTTGVFEGSGTLTIEGDSGTIVASNAANTFSGDIVFETTAQGTGSLKVASLGGGSYGGVISGDGDVEFALAGTQVLTGINTYTGATNVTEGELIVDGSIANSTITVSTGASISGSGNLGAMTIAVGGFHNPGNSPGIANTGNYTLAGTLNAEIEGITAGSEHDQVNVTGAVDITGGDLVTLFSTGTYAENDLIFILLNDGADAITGTFNGLAQGDTVANFGGFNWVISYEANGDSGSSFTGGNDIALLAVPEPTIALLASLGVFGLLRRRRD